MSGDGDDFPSFDLGPSCALSSGNPFLFDLRSADIQGPLGQFQHTINTKEEISKLVSSINGRQDSPLSDDALKAAFEIWWPQLNDDLARIAKEATSLGPAPPKPDPSEMLAELIEVTRAMQREWAQSNVGKESCTKR
jgi:hypothetical protein